MERMLINELAGAIGQTVKIQGWLQTLRDQKKMQFLVIRDPGGMVQVVNEKDGNPNLAQQVSALNLETPLTITGVVTSNPVVKLGGLDPIRFYLDFFRYGCPPHGGFGFGLSRFQMVLLGIQNIRETVFLFRGPTRLNP